MVKCDLEQSALYGSKDGVNVVIVCEVGRHREAQRRVKVPESKTHWRGTGLEKPRSIDEKCQVS